MTITVRNTDTHKRVWPTLHRADGAVLVLEPGEEAEVEDKTAGPFLAVAAPKKTKAAEVAASTDTGGS